MDEQSPAVVAALEGIRIQLIAAGGWHSAAISGEKIDVFGLSLEFAETALI